LIQAGVMAIGVDRLDDPELRQDATIYSEIQDAADAVMVFTGLKTPPLLAIAPGVIQAQGLADDVTGLFNGGRAAVARFLNQLTYYEVVGAALTANVLTKLTPGQSIRLHLVGHSFGARLVTAAANTLTTVANLDFFSITLLQGAFSHNAFSTVPIRGTLGAFLNVVGKPTGPISITHTHNDVACTLYYALASRLSRDMTSAIGDANDDFGAMGANGPQQLKHGTSVADDTSAAFHPQRGKVNTFLADKFVVDVPAKAQTPALDAHNNVTNPECGRLLAATIEA